MISRFRARDLLVAAALLAVIALAGCTQTAAPTGSATSTPSAPPDAIVALDTSAGTILLSVDLADTPITAHNFLNLTRAGFYDGTRFHRVEGPGHYPPNGFVIQGGDPNSRLADRSKWGYGGSNATIPDEFPRGNGSLALPFDRAGILGMANANKPNTGSSQFFLTLAPAPTLNGNNTAFGHVIAGMGVVQSIGNVPVDNASRPLADIFLYRATALNASTMR